MMLEKESAISVDSEDDDDGEEEEEEAEEEETEEEGLPRSEYLLSGGRPSMATDTHRRTSWR